MVKEDLSNKEESVPNPTGCQLFVVNLRFEVHLILYWYYYYYQESAVCLILVVATSLLLISNLKSAFSSVNITITIRIMQCA